MTNKLSQNGLQFVLCPGKSPEKQHIAVYNQIYDCWYNLWAKAYEEIHCDQPLYSDTFTRQDFVGAVFFEGKCQSFILFRHVDLSLNSTLKDSYFEQWSEINIAKACGRKKNVLVCGNFGINPEARKDKLGPIKDLMLGFITEISLHSTADVVISTPRTDKRVNEIVYKWGGTQIAKNVNWGHDVVVDLTAFYKPQVIENRSQHSEILAQVKKLWSEMLIIHEDPIETLSHFSENILELDKIKKAG